MGGGSVSASQTPGIAYDVSVVASGSRFRVRADDRFGPAFLITNRKSYLFGCCFAWGFERVVIEEGSIVEVLGIEHRASESYAQHRQLQQTLNDTLGAPNLVTLPGATAGVDGAGAAARAAGAGGARTAAAAADGAAGGGGDGTDTDSVSSVASLTGAGSVSKLSSTLHGSGSATTATNGKPKGGGGGKAAATAPAPPDPDMFYRVKVWVCYANRSLENEIGVIRSVWLDLTQPLGGGSSTAAAAAAAAAAVRAAAASGASRPKPAAPGHDRMRRDSGDGDDALPADGGGDGDGGGTGDADEWAPSGYDDDRSGAGGGAERTTANTIAAILKGERRRTGDDDAMERGDTKDDVAIDVDALADRLTAAQHHHHHGDGGGGLPLLQQPRDEAPRLLQGFDDTASLNLRSVPHAGALLAPGGGRGAGGDIDLDDDEVQGVDDGLNELHHTAAAAGGHHGHHHHGHHHHHHHTAAAAATTTTAASSSVVVITPALHGAVPAAMPLPAEVTHALDFAAAQQKKRDASSAALAQAQAAAVAAAAAASAAATAALVRPHQQAQAQARGPAATGRNPRKHANAAVPLSSSAASVTITTVSTTTTATAAGAAKGGAGSRRGSPAATKLAAGQTALTAAAAAAAKSAAGAAGGGSKPPVHPPAQQKGEHKTAPAPPAPTSGAPKIDKLVVVPKGSKNAGAKPPSPQLKPQASSSSGSTDSKAGGRLPASLFALHLPPVVDAPVLDTFVQMLRAPAGTIRDLSYRSLCQKLFGTQLTVPAAVLKPWMKPALAAYQARLKQFGNTHPDAVNFALLSLFFQTLVSVTVQGSELCLAFDFGHRKDTYDFLMPSVDQYILESHLARDPYRVDARNRVKKIASESRTFVIRNRVRFRFDAERLTSLHDGDIRVRAAFMNWSASAWTETTASPGFVQTDFSSGKPILKTGDDGKPLIIDSGADGKHYVPRKSDVWLVMSVMGFKAYLTVPDMPVSSTAQAAAAAAAVAAGTTPSLVSK